MHRRPLQAAAVASVVMAPRPSPAALQVIYQGPDSRPIGQLSADGPAAAQAAPRTVPPTSGPALPLRPHHLAVGEQPDRPLPAIAGVARPRPPRPLFLVGSDAVSLTWLAANAEDLQRIGAIGMIVEAASESDIARVQRVAPALPMFAAPGDDLAAQLGIVRYPVVIGPDSIRSVP